MTADRSPDRVLYEALTQPALTFTFHLVTHLAHNTAPSIPARPSNQTTTLQWPLSPAATPVPTASRPMTDTPHHVHHPHHSHQLHAAPAHAACARPLSPIMHHQPSPQKRLSYHRTTSSSQPSQALSSAPSKPASTQFYHGVRCTPHPPSSRKPFYVHRARARTGLRC